MGPHGGAALRALWPPAGSCPPTGAHYAIHLSSMIIMREKKSPLPGGDVLKTKSISMEIATLYVYERGAIGDLNCTIYIFEYIRKDSDR